MELRNGVKAFYARSASAWRKWLEKNHGKEESVWLIIYKKSTNVPSVYYPEAVDEALCFGWIDSKGNKRDDESYYQFFSRRNPKSNWSAINKKKVGKLLKEGQMAKAGLDMVALAKKNGTWTALDNIEKLVLPQELSVLFTKDKKAFQHWEAFPKSTKRGILEWIGNAKREETRMKRIQETVALAGKNVRANQYRQVGEAEGRKS